jgi:thioredoxin-related protein
MKDLKMRKILTILAASMLTFGAWAQEVKWFTIEEAVELNKTEPKKIMVDVYTDWCGWCKVMDKNTFKQPVVANYLNENFYPVKFNAEQKEDVNILGSTFKYVSNGSRGSHQLAAALGATGYPFVVFLDENMNIITSLPGYTKAPQFDKVINYINGEHYKDKDFDTWAASYTSPIASE